MLHLLNIIQDMHLKTTILSEIHRRLGKTTAINAYRRSVRLLKNRRTLETKDMCQQVGLQDTIMKNQKANNSDDGHFSKRTCEHEVHFFDPLYISR